MLYRYRGRTQTGRSWRPRGDSLGSEGLQEGSGCHCWKREKTHPSRNFSPEEQKPCVAGGRLAKPCCSQSTGKTHGMWQEKETNTHYPHGRGADIGPGLRLLEPPTSRGGAASPRPQDPPETETQRAPCPSSSRPASTEEQARVPAGGGSRGTGGAGGAGREAGHEAGTSNQPAPSTEPRQPRLTVTIATTNASLAQLATADQSCRNQTPALPAPHAETAQQKSPTHNAWHSF